MFRMYLYEQREMDTHTYNSGEGLNVFIQGFMSQTMNVFMPRWKGPYGHEHKLWRVQTV